MDLSTQYLGFTLPHPLMLGASPLTEDVDNVRRAEDSGAAAIVMRSLFEEQLAVDSVPASAPQAKARYYQAERREFSLKPERYLEQIRRIKDAVSLPVIASLNGVSARGWLDYAKLLDQAGADAIELNVYRVVTHFEESAEDVEAQTVEMVRTVKAATKIPVAVKLSPFYTSLPHFARRLVTAGADGLVLFNRFYQPDIDLEGLEVDHRIELSSSSELLLRLRWVAVLSAELEITLGVSGGVHSASDALKAIMTGAHGVQLVSEILAHGPNRFREIRVRMEEWLERHGFHTLKQVQRRMNLENCPDPVAYERANYVHVLNSWRRTA